MMNSIFNIIFVCLVVVVTVDGVYVAYNESSDSVICITVNGADAALEEVASAQVIIISVREDPSIFQSLFCYVREFFNEFLVNEV